MGFVIASRLRGNGGYQPLGTPASSQTQAQKRGATKLEPSFGFDWPNFVSAAPFICPHWALNCSALTDSGQRKVALCDIYWAKLPYLRPQRPREELQSDMEQIRKVI
jgi:hypothetical protein